MKSLRQTGGHHYSSLELTRIPGMMFRPFSFGQYLICRLISKPDLKKTRGLYRSCFHLQNCLNVFAIPETLFEQTLISLPQGYSMPNIKAFWPVVHGKKIFGDISIFFILTLIGPAPLFEQI